jgi:hypothetical protein
MDQFGRRINVEFFHYIGSVGFYGADTDAQKVGDISGGFALSDELEDLALAVGKLIVALGYGGAFKVGRTLCLPKDFGD